MEFPSFEPRTRPAPYREMNEYMRVLIKREWTATFTDLQKRARKDSDLPIEAFDTRCVPSILSWCQAFRPVMIELMTPYDLCYASDDADDEALAMRFVQRGVCAPSGDEVAAFRSAREALCPLFENMWRVDQDAAAQYEYACAHKDAMRLALDALYAVVPPARCTELCQCIGDWTLLQQCKTHVDTQVEALCARINRRCAACNRRAPNYRCARCRSEYYCDLKCQADHYRQHRAVCRALAPQHTTTTPQQHEEPLCIEAAPAVFPAAAAATQAQ